jgi:cbb3-type cytochrome oxidase maturation protein
MSIIYVLIPLSVILMGFAIGFFFWAVKNNQFDDLDSPALDMLDDDPPADQKGSPAQGTASEEAADNSTDSR